MHINNLQRRENEMKKKLVVLGLAGAIFLSGMGILNVTLGVILHLF